MITSAGLHLYFDSLSADTQEAITKVARIYYGGMLERCCCPLHADLFRAGIKWQERVH